MAFVEIGACGAVTAYYCDATRQFLCLDTRGTAILEAFELGISLTEVRIALGNGASEDLETEKLWKTLTDARATRPEPDAVSQQVRAGTGPDPGFAHTCTEHLDVDCGPVKVRLSATAGAAAQIFPIMSRYYQTLHPGFVGDSEGQIFLVDRPEGLIEKIVVSPSYEAEDMAGEARSVFVEMSKDLTEMACAYSRNLCVLHAATLQKDDRTLILCNPSGSGKTTLAWLLVHAGYELVHDDVLPLRLDGGFESLNTPSTVKKGSWSALSDAGLELPDEYFDRFNTQVKYYPIVPGTKNWPAEMRFILFPTYRPGQRAQFSNLSGIETFSRIVSEECVIRDRSHRKLQKIFEWITSSRGAVMSYSNSSEVVSRLDHWMRGE